MVVDAALMEAVEGLYRAFEMYVMPEGMEACGGCHGREAEVRLRSAPLRALGAEDLREYAGSALLTWGDDRMFRHFVPRLMELLVTLDDPDEMECPAILMSKFRVARWRGWPEVEQRAVEEFLRAMWEFELGREGMTQSWEPDVEAWICAVAQAEENLGWYLKRWEEMEGMEATFALASMVVMSAVARDEIRGRDEFWGGCEGQYAQLRRWVRSEGVTRKLEAGALGWAGRDEADVMWDAVGLLGRG